jgi:orotidine-5'-phosphate decarboxylase
VVSFGDRLAAAVDARGALCVGIDPHAALLRAWGVGEDVRGLETFSRTVVAALADRVAVLKPQSAFYERFGSAGIAVLERTVRAAREAGALVLLDAKRGDIGSTAAAYAEAYLHPDSPLAVDALTVSPFLGAGSLDPLVDTAACHGAGVFVLALTSNPEGPALQHAVRADGRTVARAIRDWAAAANAAARGDQAGPLGHVGLVVGATVDPEAAAGLDLAGLHGAVLAPGLGAQGAGAQDLARVFGAARSVVLPTTSREVLAAGPTTAGLREAAARTLAECIAALT